MSCTAPPIADVDRAYSKRRKRFVRKFSEGEIKEIRKDVLGRYCSKPEIIVDGKTVDGLKIEPVGKELDSLSGWFEELLKQRKRTKDMIRAVIVAIIGSSALTAFITYKFLT